MKVFILWHHHPDDPNDDNAKLLGVYSSRAIAESRIDQKYRQLAGCNHDGGQFTIDPYELDQDHWAEGWLQME